MICVNSNLFAVMASFAILFPFTFILFILVSSKVLSMRRREHKLINELSKYTKVAQILRLKNPLGG